MIDWSKYPNFSKAEFECSHTGKCEMDKDFMDKLQELRSEACFPFIITSGYRDVTHPIEAAKGHGGEHTLGKAVDIAVSRQRADKVLELSYKYGFTRRGVSQSGDGRFLHLGTATQDDGFLENTVWSY